MLQNFIDKRYRSVFENGCAPRLEYFNIIDEASAKIPRAMHMHDNTVEILLVCRGNGIQTIGRDRYATKKGDLVFYNSGVLHDEIAGHQGSWATYCLGVSNLKLAGMEKNKIIPDGCCPVIESGEYFREILCLFKLMEANVKQKDEHFVEMMNCLSAALIVKFCSVIKLRNSPKAAKDASLATKVQSYIDKHYADGINLDAIAAAVNANKYYLSHIFKAETGFSPKQYIIRRRIGEAQNLLINSDWSITHIAAAVGYNDSNYFQNVFHKNVGITPGCYRYKWKKQQNK